MTQPIEGTGFCNVCQQPVPSVELVDHIRVMHPDHYGDGPQLWPDGQRVVIDGDPDPQDVGPLQVRCTLEDCPEHPGGMFPEDRWP